MAQSVAKLIVNLPELLSDIWKRPVVRPPMGFSSSLEDESEAELSLSESLPAAQNLLLISRYLLALVDPSNKPRSAKVAYGGSLWTKCTRWRRGPIFVTMTDWHK